MYLTFEQYEELGGTALENDIVPKLQEASDHIDALTFYRIRARGWDRLTSFQQENIQRACMVQADFLFENADAVASAMSEYAINGVHMKFGNAALYSIVAGVPISNVAKGLLDATGLTVRMALGREVEPCYTPVW